MIITLKKVVLERTSVESERFMPLIKSTITMMIASVASEAKAAAAVIKKDFKIL